MIARVCWQSTSRSHLRPALALTAALLAGLATSPSAATIPASVKLGAAGPAAITIDVVTPALTLTPLTAEAGMTRLTLEGYDTDGEVGSPALPLRLVTVAVPPTGAVTVRAAGVDADIREGVLLAPVPGVDPSDRERRPIVSRSLDAYARRDPRGADRARLLGVSWMRNQRVARIAILPAEYDAPARRLSVYRQVHIVVDVEPIGALGPPAEAVDPFEHIYQGVLLNYEQGRAWRRPSMRSLFPRDGASRVVAAALLAVADTLPSSNVYSGRNWVKIAVDRSGFFKVGFDQLRNLDLFQDANGQDLTTHLDDVRLFTWQGVPVLPTDSYCDSCGYHEVSIAWSDDGDGLFNKNEDYFYFFALGPSDWASLYDSARPDTVFIDHPYATQNFYYLTRTTHAPPGDTLLATAPKRIASVDGTLLGGEPEIATFPARVHLEQDNEYWPDASPLANFASSTIFWEKWFWRSRSQGETFVSTFDATGADTTQPARLRVHTWGLSSNLSPPNGYHRSIPDHFLNITFDAQPFPERVFYDLLPQTFDSTYSGGTLRPTNSLQMFIRPVTDPFNPIYRVDRVGLAWIELYYQRRFEPVNDELAFDSPVGGGTFVYRVGPFTDPTAPEVFDVTDAADPVRITFPGSQYQPVTGGYQLSFRATDSGRHRYRVLSSAKIVKLPAASLYDAPATSLDNLRSPTLTGDYLVIYYDGFKAAADTLADWRSSHLPIPGGTGSYATRTIPVSALFDQFSGGRTDPAAIRNFLRFAYRNWNGGGKPPTYVTFLGDASYDFKNITGRAPAGQPGTLVPSFENGFDTQVHRQFATDDWMLNVDNPSEIIPDFLGGRIPVDDAATALDVVRNKVLRYERDVPLGDYRNRVVFVADDNEQGAAVDVIGWGHLSQTTRIDSLYTPPEIDRAYVYLHTYADGPGETKPGAKADIKKYLNEGAAMLNYIGHGSPFKLADESVFLDTDVGTLVNAPRYFVFVAASCDVGKFNDPTVNSLGERLITRNGGGAIAVISATELAFSGQNEQLNQILYGQIFLRDSSDCAFHNSLAEALLAAKFGSTNNQKYQLMGDAATRLNLPHLWSEITFEPDSGGAPLTEFHRGQTVHFKGRVLDCPGGSAVSMNGVASVLIEDSRPLLDVPDCIPGFYCTQYYFKAGPIYRGEVSIANGLFDGRFVVPLEAREGPHGRARAYVQGSVTGSSVPTDGVGTLQEQLSNGSGNASDQSGPRITLSFVGGATSVRPDAELRVDLFDASGILTTGHAPQNGIVVTVDGNTTSRADITSTFRYAAESYQSGTATYRLPGLTPGAHQVLVTAADNLAAGLGAGAHRSSATLDFLVVDSPPLRIERAYLFPNPAASGGSRSGGQFVIDAPGDSVNVLVRLYTASGRMIRILKAFGGQGQVQIAWDGLDDEGAALANGIYFFTVHVNGRDETGASIAQQRDDAQGRFVILKPH